MVQALVRMRNVLTGAQMGNRPRLIRQGHDLLERVAALAGPQRRTAAQEISGPAAS
jgi:hypothetical protein